MNIAYIVSGTSICGGIAVILQHANRLIARMHQLTIISTARGGDLSWFPNNHARLVELHLLVENPGALNLDCVVATHWMTVFALRHIKAKSKYYFVQSDERRFYPGNESLQSGAHMTYHTLCNYFTCAQWLTDWLLKEFGHKSVVVPNAVDPGIFYEVCSDRQNAHRPVVLIEGPISIGWKGVVDAYESVKDLDCDIWIISSYGSPPPDWRIARYYPGVPHDQMRKIYSGADVLLKMSRIEGAFLPPAEAMACGCAVVAARCTGSDIYTFDGQNCLLVDVGDTRAARDAVSRILGNHELRNKLVDNGRKTASSMLWENSIDILEDMFKCHIQTPS